MLHYLEWLCISNSLCGSTENRTQSYSFSDYRAYLIYTSDPYTVTLLEVRGFTVSTGGRSGIRTHTLLINSQLLYRWSYSPSLIVSIIGLKPITSWVVTKCSIHLSYMSICAPWRIRTSIVYYRHGFGDRCITNYAKDACAVIERIKSSFLIFKYLISGL